MNLFPCTFRTFGSQELRKGFHFWLRLWSLLLVVGGAELADAQVTNGFGYTNVSGSITITGYDCSSNVVVIPAFINGLPVTRIGESAFYQCTNLTEVLLPDSVVQISDYAFYRCSGLTNILLPPNIQTIGDSAFRSCGFIEFDIPASLQNLGDYVFQNCPNLLEINVDTANPNFSTEGGVLFDKVKAVLIRYPEALTPPSYSIPSTVKTIGFGAFQSSKLTSVAIPSGVTRLLDDAFHGCALLTSISIPEGVTEVGSFAFFGCSRLAQVDIPDSVHEIASYQFYQCGKLTDVSLPPSITSIGYYSFAGTGLGSVVLPEGVVTVGPLAFSGCSRLTSIFIPKTVTALAANALNQCPRLAEIQVDPLNPAYRSFAGVLFDKNRTVLIQYPLGNTADSYTIPDGVVTIGNGSFSGVVLSHVDIPKSVTTIGSFAFSGSGLESVEIPVGTLNLGNGAFFGCSLLNSVALPNGIRQIGDYAFQYCYQLSAISIPPSVTRLGQYAFFGCSKLLSVTIPASVSSIGSSAFSQCPVLSVANFEGNAPRAEAPLLFDGSPTIVCYLPGTTGWKSTYGGAKTVLCPFLNPVIVTTGNQFGVTDKGFGFSILWAANASVIVEASPSLVAPSWAPISTNIIKFTPGSSDPSNGISQFIDSSVTERSYRFYRLRW
jgi:BspA type Leucine rich repeat region (6 copies)